MFEKWKRAAEEPADLNLIPVMNLFMVLIPFLLMGAAFVHIGVIPTSTPTQKESSTKAQKKDQKPDSVMANLVVTPEKLEVSFTGSNIPQENLDEMGRSWSISKGNYPHDEMQRVLQKAKKTYPESNTVTVLPHEDFEYQDLVEILDHTRERKIGTKPGGEPKYKPLFPVTVFSKFIPPDNDGNQKKKGGGE